MTASGSKVRRISPAVSVEFPVTLPFDSIHYEWEDGEKDGPVYAVSESRMGSTRILVFNASKRG